MQTQEVKGITRTYALICLGDITTLESTMKPEEFVKLNLEIRKIHNVTDRTHFEIWEHNSMMWYPVYGVQNPTPLLELTGPDDETFRRAQVEEYISLGDKAVKLYKGWKKQAKQLARYIRGHESEGSNSDHLKKEHDNLLKDIALIDEIVACISSKLPLQELFRLKYRQLYELQKIALELHLSTSSASRYTNDLKCTIGADLHNILSNDEIERKFHIEWQYEKWRYLNKE